MKYVEEGKSQHKAKQTKSRCKVGSGSHAKGARAGQRRKSGRVKAKAKAKPQGVGEIKSVVHVGVELLHGGR